MIASHSLGTCVLQDLTDSTTIELRYIFTLKLHYQRVITVIRMSLWSYFFIHVYKNKLIQTLSVSAIGRLHRI